MRTALAVLGLAAFAATLSAQERGLPPLPDSTGWGVHVLAVARDPWGSLWVGTYGQGVFRLRPGAPTWERIRRDTSATSLSWDFVHAFAFGERGAIWYGTVGNGWGVSHDGGATWKNWTYRELGPEWQYVAPDGILTRGDTTWVATADGLQMTTDDGAHWTAFTDPTGPPARGPADDVVPVLTNEYVRRIGWSSRGLLLATLKGNERLSWNGASWVTEPLASAAFRPRGQVVLNGVAWKGSHCGLKRATDTLPCLQRGTAAPLPPRAPLTTWFRRPIDRADNSFIDQTYRYGSTMGGNFQQHQGVEFNNPDGTPVLAIGGGRVVYAGPAEQGALTVAIRHDSVIVTPQARLRVYSVYYHNAALRVLLGQKVEAGDTIALVGNSGRATNDHLHLEVHAAPTDSIGAIVDSLERYPRYTTNPELWIEPLPGTGIVAGQVFDKLGEPVPQARIYGLVKPDPVETPFSYIETYGDRAHPHPLYGEHFAIGDVPPGTYVLGTEIGGKRVYRSVLVEPGKVSWVVFRP